MKKHRPLLRTLASTILIGASVLAAGSVLAQCNFVESTFLIHNKTKNWYLQLQIDPWNDNDFYGTMKVGNMSSGIADQPPRIPPGGDGTLIIQSPQIRDYEQIDVIFSVGSTADPWTFNKNFYVIAKNSDPGVFLISPCLLHLKYGMLESTTGDGRAALTSVGIDNNIAMYPRTLIACKQTDPNKNEVDVTDVIP